MLSNRLNNHFTAAAAAAAIISAAHDASAVIVHSGPVNIAIPVTTAGTYLNVVTGVNNPSPALVPGWDMNPWAAGSLSWFNAGTAAPCYVTGGGSSTTLVDNLAVGTLIDGASAFGSGVTESTGATAAVLNSTSNIIGFRFTNENTGTVNYGWVRVRLGASQTDATRAIVEYAYEDSGAGIGAGATSSGGPTNPTGVTVHTPAGGLAGSSFTAVCTVTPGTIPDSTFISVTADASAVGAGSVVLLDNGVFPDVTANDNQFTATITTSAATTFGPKAINYTVADFQGRSSVNSANYTISITNDDCTTASTASTGANPFDNSSASNDGLAVCVGSSKDVWFTFNSGAAGGTFTFDTCTGTAQDTVLALFDSCGGTQLFCDDDTCGVQSAIENVVLAANTDVLVRVAGFGTGAAGGAGVLTITEIVPPPPADWTEVDDAGDLPATAQVPVGSGALNTLDGTIAAGELADMYEINICDFTTFSATSLTTRTNGQDTQLFLFDANGAAVQMNDDTPSGVGPSGFANEFVTANGKYYIAISHYDNDPNNATPAEIWADTPFGTVRQPDALGVTDFTVASWVGTNLTEFPYRLVMTGTCFAPDDCAADFNGDTVVDFFDYLDFVDAFSANDPSADFNNDTVIDFFDYLDFVDAFSAGC